MLLLTTGDGSHTASASDIIIVRSYYNLFIEISVSYYYSYNIYKGHTDFKYIFLRYLFKYYINIYNIDKRRRKSFYFYNIYFYFFFYY